MTAELQLLRYAETGSVLHRADARTKVIALTAMALILSFDPSWSTAATTWAVVIMAFVATRLPRSVIPRPPKVLWWGIGLSLLFGLLAGGEPTIEFGGLSLAVGGLVFQFRFLAVSFGYLALALLLGWTTPLGQLPNAASWLMAPLRYLRIPIDDVVAGLALSVRALPLIADELTTTTALWSARPKAHKNSLVNAVDLAATATVAATRRAAELGEALAARGRYTAPPNSDRFGYPDLAVALTISVVLATSVLL
ncbi:MAG: energy-coupling factor transporter transmembrane component T family protein [Acidimicrobiales bacterium]